MKTEQIVLNLLVFDQARKAGMQQLAMLHHVVDLGIGAAEIRREYFDDVTAEIAGIASYAKAHQLQLFYSVPDELFVNQQLNPKLTQYYDEAQAMGVTAIKFNIGDFVAFSQSDVSELKQLLARGIQTNIENDQTLVSGRLMPIQRFMVGVQQSGLDVGYVYDMGNWRYVNEDEVVAAQQLSHVVRYIHVKDDQGVAEILKTVPLGEGEIQWQNILQLLPSNVPVAIEYPTQDDTVIKRGIDDLLNYEAHQS